MLARQIFTLFMKRRAESHKGQHGRVMVIGGSKGFYGAPVLAALGALYSGADLVHLVVPSIIASEVKCVAGADFIVHDYEGENFNEAGVGVAIELSRECDAIIAGSGFGNYPELVKVVASLLEKINIPAVLDAEAIFALKDEGGLKKFSSPTIITPHKTEFARLFGEEIPNTATEFKAVVRKAALDTDSYIVLKGAKDYLISPKGHIFVNTTGNPGMTVGGTGDVLGGITASFIAQHLDIMSACNCAAFASGAAGDILFKHYGYFYSASQVAKALPLVLKKLI